MQIEKNIAFLINQQFPAIYRENGPELVNLVEEYYNFIETDEKQSGYVGRRIFEYKDITTTISSMITFFQKKYMADLPFREDTVRFIARNIMDLYRRKGTKSGIELFFKAFYNENVEIFYPAAKMFKPSDSKWKTGTYLQMFPNSNYFVSNSGVEYDYNDLLGRNIRGSNSYAKAVVDKINFIILNGISTAIIYIEEVRGTFQRFDDILTNINGEVINFGRANGSLSSFLVDTDFAGSVNNKVGDIYDISSSFGRGGKAIVTKVTEDFTGLVNFDIVDGGYGYTLETSEVIVSDQIIILPNPDLIFEIGETLSADGGTNTGIVIGQSVNSVGVKMNSTIPLPNQNFVTNSVIETVDRDVNFTLQDISLVTVKNDTAGASVGTLENATNVTLITDEISPFLATTLGAADYEATAPMSGTASPVNLTTPIDQAFALQTFTIGSIGSLSNINPGSNYINDTFTIVIDPTISQLQRYNQIIYLTDPSTAGQFSVGEIIQEEGTLYKGIVKSTNLDQNTITITPYTYYGFSGTNRILRGTIFAFPVNVDKVDTDYSSRVLGDNASIKSVTEFSVGRIAEVAINASGFGYVDESEAFLLNDLDEVQCSGIIETVTQGQNSGYWSSLTSHINGYQQSGETLTYYDSGMKIQDSDYYQEYSYEIQSTIGIERYEVLAKENVHLAGSKMFGQFTYKNIIGGGTQQRFVRIFNENGENLAVTDPDLNRDFNTDPIIP